VAIPLTSGAPVARDRRNPNQTDRRRTPRGGRRASDALRYATCAAVVAVTAVSAAEAQVGRGWTTSGTQILTPAGTPFVISGINWYGFETTNDVAHGLWSKDYTVILDQIKSYGYNTVRLPFSNEMWELNPVPSGSVAGCPSCGGKRARDIMALIINYAGSIGLHVILDNHRSAAGNSADASELWYTSTYPEQAWIRDWVSVQEWVHGIGQTLGAADTVSVSPFAVDGYPTVIGFDLRNEPHTPSTYMSASTWGTGDGIDPRTNPNPNPFAPACVATSSCRDWRLAAERAANTILGEAARNGWEYPLIFVEGISKYPRPGGTAASGPYDNYWWGGNLLGVNGNSTNPGAPVVLNEGGDSSRLGPPVYDQLVYSTHDYGPALYRQSWFNSNTCYASGCSASSLADVWAKYWAHLTFPGGINPVWPGHAAYPWSNTGHLPIDRAPMYIGEFGTGNLDNDLVTSGAGSQGQWMTSIVNFIDSSYPNEGTLNYSGVPVSNLHWTYWALNTEDSYSLLGRSYEGLANTKKEYSFLCYIQQGLVAVPMGSTAGTCGSTGALPPPDSTATPPSSTVPAAPGSLTASAGGAEVSLNWTAVSDATSYTVKSSTATGGPYQVIQSGITTTSFVHSGLTNGVTYFYVVAAVNSAGEGAHSIEASAMPTAFPLAAPTGLTATSGDSKVSLAWTPVSGATSYTVRYSTVNGGPYQAVATGLTAATFVHTGLTNGTTYYYVVSVIGSAGESANSAQVSATPAAPPVATGGISVWWPTDGAVLSGKQPFKGRVEGWSLSSYRMWWQVDGDKLNRMYDSDVDGAHKEAIVDVSSWTWRGNGPYVVNFVAKDRQGKLLGQKSVTVYVAR
jgi:aryl-phospho-beta-D-glucosidase BglC (GH1 family)